MSKTFYSIICTLLFSNCSVCGGEPQPKVTQQEGVINSGPNEQGEKNPPHIHHRKRGGRRKKEAAKRRAATEPTTPAAPVGPTLAIEGEKKPTEKLGTHVAADENCTHGTTSSNSLSSAPAHEDKDSKTAKKHEDGPQPQPGCPCCA